MAKITYQIIIQSEVLDPNSLVIKPEEIPVELTKGDWLNLTNSSEKPLQLIVLNVLKVMNHEQKTGDSVYRIVYTCGPRPTSLISNTSVDDL